MAIMYPNRFPEFSKSSGEKKVYEYLKSQTPDTWYVLHSYMIPEHSKVIFGEADFIVIGPEIGIVILEIKSGGIGFDGSEWSFIDRKGHISKKRRGPFAQARDAMFEIERLITTHLTNSYNRFNILYNYGVIFTDEEDFPIEQFPEWESWRLKQHDENNDYKTFLFDLTTHYLKELSDLGKKIPPNINEQNVKNIAEALRPKVECLVPLRSFLQSTEDDIIKLTNEQFHCLDDIEENARILVTGGAGTGKTVLAVETAKQKSEQELSVLFLCYNQNLAYFIKSLLHRQNITVNSMHKYMWSICSSKVSDKKTSSDFFSTELPLICTELIDNSFIKFDYLIIDEFQDVCTNEYLDFFDKILKKGLKNGSFSFFGDFSRQAIYSKQSNIENLSNRTFYAKKKLTINCRNTENIGNELINISGYEDKKYRLSIAGEKVDYIIWDTLEDQKRELRNIITNLNKLRIPSKDIVILSPNKREKSIINEIDPDLNFITDYENNNIDGFFAVFSTIHAFKGLESKVIIICDIDSYDNKHLLYIGFSRARTKLIVLESREANLQRTNLTARR